LDVLVQPVSRKLRSWLFFGRLAPGVSIEAAREEADGFAGRVSESYGDPPLGGANII
jgi:hypothetical protein